MRARAPGKVVLSGAYSVLEGASAIVAAVDRYVVASSDSAGELLTDELKAAGFTTPYWFDASALRQDGMKLGLGSSAAILVASLAVDALLRCPDLSRVALIDHIQSIALEAHRTAQGGGSGIDVAASCHGGILGFLLGSNGPQLEALPAPEALHIEVWASRDSASTPGMLAATRRLAEQHATIYRQDIARQGAAADTTARAWRDRDWQRVIVGLIEQRYALERLGLDANIPILTPEVRALADRAERHSAAVLPAGAGGGDIALYVGNEPSHFMDDAIVEWGHARLPIRLGALGVHADIPPTENS